MSDMKCPICHNSLHKINIVVSTCTNDKCKLWGSSIPNLVLKALAQTKQDLERTRKALDVVSAKNVPGPIKLYVCPDGSVYDNEDVAKSHTASIFNPLPAGATTTDRVYLEQELERTRKALDKAKKHYRNLKMLLPVRQTYLMKLVFQCMQTANCKK